MTTNIIDGRKIAGGIVGKLKEKSRPAKFLAIFIVGEEPTITNFVEQKRKLAAELGVDFRIYHFPETIQNDELRKEVLKTAEHKTCGGVIVQLPLPGHLNKHYVMNVIPREKDADVLGERALGAFYTGRNPVLPPAVGTVEEILSVVSCQLSVVKVAVVGLGLLVGKPIATWLTGKCQELYLLGRGGDFGILKEADVVISGTGEAGLIKPGMLKENVLVIDFGYSMDKSGKVQGDFDAGQVSDVSGQMLTYTPTPGGTGPVLVAKVFENFYNLNAPK